MFFGKRYSVSSEFLNGLKSDDAIDKMNDWLEEKGVGKRTINFKLRDWLFSRQRFWGEPFPVIHFEDGTYKALDESELPVDVT